MEETTTYRIRPHHGMCLYFFEGKGYSDGFTAHMAEVKNWLLGEKGPASLQLVGETDEICSACPIIRVVNVNRRKRWTATTTVSCNTPDYRQGRNLLFRNSKK